MIVRYKETHVFLKRMTATSTHIAYTLGLAHIVANATWGGKAMERCARTWTSVKAFHAKMVARVMIQPMPDHSSKSTFIHATV
jgi:hypothetical protein